MSMVNEDTQNDKCNDENSQHEQNAQISQPKENTNDVNNNKIIDNIKENVVVHAKEDNIKDKNDIRNLNTDENTKEVKKDNNSDPIGYKCTHCDFKASDNPKLQSHFQDMHLDDFVEQTIMQTLKDNMPKALLNSNQDELRLLKEKATKSFIGDIKDNNMSKQTDSYQTKQDHKEEKFPVKSGLELPIKKKPGRPKGYSPKLAAAGLPQTNLNKEEVVTKPKPVNEEIQDKPKIVPKEEIKESDEPEMKRIRADRSKGTCVELPNGWKRQTWLRKNGVMAGKFDVCVWNRDGQKFRSKIGLEKYCKDNNITDIDINQYFTPDQEFFQDKSQVSITNYFKTKFDESNEIPESSQEVSVHKEKESDKHKRQKLLLQNLTPLGLWSARKKKAIMAKHPEWSLSQVARLIAAAWKKVGNDEVQRLKAEIDAMNGSVNSKDTNTSSVPSLPPPEQKPKINIEINKSLGFKCKHCDHKASSAVKLDTHTIVMH